MSKKNMQRTNRTRLRGRPHAALLLLLLAASLPSAVHAQDRDRARDTPPPAGLPRDVAREVAAVWNLSSTRHERGPFTLAAGDTVRGDLAVLEGNATLAGTVTGQVVVINGDLTIEPTAHIGDGGITLVGGRLIGSDLERTTSGDIRVWRARLRYTMEDEQIVPEPESELSARWQRWRRTSEAEGVFSTFFVTTAHTYNRVEGLPLYVGPRLRVRRGATRFDGEVYGIFRTGDRLVWEPANLGHRIKMELRQGRGPGVAIGGRLFDEVDAVEKWQLNNGEVGLASFVFTRDYRDYWNRHGGLGYVRAFADSRSGITFSLGQERWTSRSSRDPWSLIDNDVPWRFNPAATEGVVQLSQVEAIWDTRNNPDRPRTGWYLTAQYERGNMDVVSPGASTAQVTPVPTTPLDYGRLFLDFRRYNRLGPGAQLNLRAVMGGLVQGDSLPLQRRLSVSGVDALPGYDFRRIINEDYDVGTCVGMSNEAYAAIGRPANCQRMLLLQAEWKGDFRVQLFNDRDYGDERWFSSRFDADGTWVVFVNSGRGWDVGNNTGPNTFARGKIPSPGTWRTDIGGGFDLGDLGFYVAKAVTDGKEKPNFFIRLGHRF